MEDTWLYTLHFAYYQVTIASDKDALKSQRIKYLPIGEEPSNIQLDSDKVKSCSNILNQDIFDGTGTGERTRCFVNSFLWS